MMALDDLTPEENRPAGWRGKPDPKRELVFRGGPFVAAEPRSWADAAVLLLIRRDAAEDFPGEELRDSRRAGAPGRKEPW